MIDQNKVQQFLKIVNYAKDDIGGFMRNITNICEEALGSQQSLKEMIANYESENNMHKKNGMMEGLRTLASYFLNDLDLLSEELNKGDDLFTDIADGRINVPEYVDERSLVLAKFKGLLGDFEYAFGQLVQHLQTFVEKPNKVNLEAVSSNIDTELEIEEVNSKVKSVSNEMIEQLDEVRTKIDKFVKINSFKR